MKSRNLKITVDILLLLTFIISLLSWEDNLTVHIIVAVVCALVTTIHVFLNRKWLLSVAKNFKSGKLSKKVKWQYIIDLLLLVAWSITILSGFPAIGFAVGKIESLFVFSKIHSISSTLVCLLIVIHILQHTKQIKAYFKKRLK